MDDMAVDSDEEVDYSKMDQVGCHKLRPGSELGIAAGLEGPTGEKAGLCKALNTRSWVLVVVWGLPSYCALESR